MKLILLLMLSINIFYIHFALADVLIVTDEYQPYVINQEGKVSGVFPEIVQSAFQESDLKVAFSIHPWKRCEFMVKEGKAFAALPYLVTDSRAEILIFLILLPISDPNSFIKNRNSHLDLNGPT